MIWDMGFMGDQGDMVWRGVVGRGERGREIVKIGRVCVYPPSHNI
jgi:hypothetical protein